MPEGQGHAGGDRPRRLFVRSGGFLWTRDAPRIRRILALAGYRVALGTPTETDCVGVWGWAPTAPRGAALAARTGARLIRIEDAFLRSLHPGRAGDRTLGLLIDRRGVHFDPETPSDLETLLATHPLDDHVLLGRARDAMARMREAHLSKYSATRLDIAPPEPGYVLVVDQIRGDASVTASKAGRARFLEMLTAARLEHPGTRVLIRSHPETAAGLRPGHFRSTDAGPGITIHGGAESPWLLLEGAVAVYTVSSQMGFEAILAGHRPRIFGQPFYAGWGLTEDEDPVPRRTRRLSRAQLFAAAMILYPVWYDPDRDAPASLEDLLAALEARSRAWREDRAGWVASGMRLWKRGAMHAFFGGQKPLIFEDDPARARARAEAEGRRRMAWAPKAPDDATIRVEDGFLRSRGLGAALVPPLSLVCDDLGIHYDPARPSRLERWIALRARRMRDDQITRSRDLIARLCAEGLTKYNLPGRVPDLPEGHRILVVGQVADDASVRLGCGAERSTDALLDRARAENPGALLLLKPHPDVEAGLRPGAADVRRADRVLEGAAMAPLLERVDEVWTLTSLAGFEALLRGVPVTTLGAPFYAGWGLTRDLGPVPARRLAGPRPTLEALVHAALIDMPRYRDPLTGAPCPVEIVLERLASGRLPRAGLVTATLSKLQGVLASRASLWRDPPQDRR